jgi:hypothetical protein
MEQSGSFRRVIDSRNRAVCIVSMEVYAVVHGKHAYSGAFNPPGGAASLSLTEELTLVREGPSYMERGGEINLTRDEAIALARLGGFVGSIEGYLSMIEQGAFGRAVVNGWLEVSGFDVNTEKMIRAEDFGRLEFPSGNMRGFMDIMAKDEMFSIEVKTPSDTIGVDVTDQLGDYLVWRDAAPGRRLLLATVSWRKNQTKLASSVSNYMAAKRILLLRFNIAWSS